MDLDAADATLSRMLAPDAPVSLASLDDLKRKLAAMITIDDRSKLAFLPLAHADLAELRRGQRLSLAHGLAELAADYDLAVLDGGAILSEEASLLFMAACNQVLLVRREGSDLSSEMAEARQMLEAASAKIAGVVVTMA